MDWYGYGYGYGYTVWVEGWGGKGGEGMVYDDGLGYWRKWMEVVVQSLNVCGSNIYVMLYKRDELASSLAQIFFKSSKYIRPSVLLHHVYDFPLFGSRFRDDLVLLFIQ